MRRLTNGKKQPQIKCLKGKGLSEGNINIYNPTGVKVNVKQIIEDEQYVIIHINGNDSKLVKLLGKINYFNSSVNDNLTNGFYWYSMPEYVADSKVYPIVYVGFIMIKSNGITTPNQYPIKMILWNTKLHIK